MQPFKPLVQRSILALVMTAVIIAFTGCASVATQQTNLFPEPKPGKGLVYFYREKKFAGMAISYNIKLNNAVIGALANGTYFFYEADPGTYTFVASTEASVSRTVSVVEGKTYYISGGVEMGMFAGRPALKVESEDEGKSIIPGLKYAIKPAN